MEAAAQQNNHQAEGKTNDECQHGFSFRLRITCDGQIHHRMPKRQEVKAADTHHDSSPEGLEGHSGGFSQTCRKV
jgi:hypothetical protein